MRICLTNTKMTTTHLKLTWDGLVRTKGNPQSTEDSHSFSVAVQGWAVICLL